MSTTHMFTCPSPLTATSFAHLTLRQPESGTYQFGAHGFGPDAADRAAELADLIVVWDEHHRPGPGPSITVHPAGAPPPATDGPRLLVPRHTTIASPGLAGPEMSRTWHDRLTS